MAAKLPPRTRPDDNIIFPFPNLFLAASYDGSSRRFFYHRALAALQAIYFLLLAPRELIVFKLLA
jgi:hypothetical protein